MTEIITWVGSLKERWGMSYTIGTRNEYTCSYYLYANMLIFTIANIWLPWKHETDAKTMKQ